MEENRNRNQTSDRSTQSNQNIDQKNQEQNRADQTGQEENPQRGDKWNNYQTRELSDEGNKQESNSSQ